MISAARIDGASDYRILSRIVAPVLRPAMASVSTFIMLLIWNDLWLPLVPANKESSRTITLGVSMFVDQCEQGDPAVFVVASDHSHTYLVPNFVPSTTQWPE